MKFSLFEKFYNYQLQQALADSVVTRVDTKDKYKRGKTFPAAPGPFPITSAERSWLKKVLAYSDAAIFLEQQTIDKLSQVLVNDKAEDFSGMVSKQIARPKQPEGQCFSLLRQALHRRQGIYLTYFHNNGTVCESISGYPYKLEYSLTRREWYLIWFLVADQTVCTTPLRLIRTARAGDEYSAKDARELEDRIMAHIKSRQCQALLEVNRKHLSDLHRVFYLFSCFEREFEFDEASQLYRLRITYLEDEAMYLLSKIRFLGERVKALEPEELAQRMRATIAKALERYESET